MDKGQTIVSRFQAGSLSGTISFLCPPVGQFTLEAQAAFFPQPGTMYAPQPADLKISLDNEDPERRGGHGTSFSLAAYTTENPLSTAYSTMPGLDTVSTHHLVYVLTQNRTEPQPRARRAQGGLRQ